MCLPLGSRERPRKDHPKRQCVGRGIVHTDVWGVGGLSRVVSAESLRLSVEEETQSSFSRVSLERFLYFGVMDLKSILFPSLYLKIFQSTFTFILLSKVPSIPSKT